MKESNQQYIVIKPINHYTYVNIDSFLRQVDKFAFYGFYEHGY